MNFRPAIKAFYPFHNNTFRLTAGIHRPFRGMTTCPKVCVCAHRIITRDISTQCFPTYGPQPMKTHEHTANIVKDESNGKTGKHSLTSLGFAEPHTILYKDTNIMRPAHCPWHRNAAERPFPSVLSAQSKATAQLSATEEKGRLAQEKSSFEENGGNKFCQ